MILTKRQRKVFTIIIAIATAALVLSSLSGALFVLLG